MRDGVKTEEGDTVEEGVVVAEVKVNTSGWFGVAGGVAGNVGAGRITRTVGCWYTDVSLLRSSAAEPGKTGIMVSVGVFGIGKFTLFSGTTNTLCSGVVNSLCSRAEVFKAGLRFNKGFRWIVDVASAKSMWVSMIGKLVIGSGWKSDNISMITDVDVSTNRVRWVGQLMFLLFHVGWYPSTWSCSTGSTKGLENISTVSVTRWRFSRDYIKGMTAIMVEKRYLWGAHEGLTSDAVNPTHKNPAGAKEWAAKSSGYPWTPVWADFQRSGPIGKTDSKWVQHLVSTSPIRKDAFRRWWWQSGSCHYELRFQPSLHDGCWRKILKRPDVSFHELL